jgi:hypothetical protein
METLTLIYRAFSVFAERYFDHKGAVSEGCLAREGSEAYYVCSTAVGAVCDAKQTEYDSLVNLLKSKSVFGHFCASGSCGGAGSCLAEDTSAFNGFLRTSARRSLVTTTTADSPMVPGRAGANAGA